MDRDPLERAREQREFILRGLASYEDALRTGIYYSADEVLAELKSKLDARTADRAATQKRLEDAFGSWNEVDGLPTDHSPSPSD
jgi:hypothetical protein